MEFGVFYHSTETGASNRGIVFKVSAETYGEVYSVVGRGRRVDARLDQISSRSGFHPFEGKGSGFSWLSSPIAEIVFLAEPHCRMRLAFKVYCCSIDYPLDDVRMRINDTLLKTSLSRDVVAWRTIESVEFFSSAGGRNRVEIVAPLFIPATFLYPASVDARRLSFAIAVISFESRS